MIFLLNRVLWIQIEGLLVVGYGRVKVLPLEGAVAPLLLGLGLIGICHLWGRD